MSRNLDIYFCAEPTHARVRGSGLLVDQDGECHDKDGRHRSGDEV